MKTIHVTKVSADSSVAYFLTFNLQRSSNKRMSKSKSGDEGTGVDNDDDDSDLADDSGETNHPRVKTKCCHKRQVSQKF